MLTPLLILIQWQYITSQGYLALIKFWSTKGTKVWQNCPSQTSVYRCMLLYLGSVCSWLFWHFVAPRMLFFTSTVVTVTVAVDIFRPVEQKLTMACVADNNTEAEERAAGSGDSWVRVGQYGADHRASEHGARWRCRQVQSTQRRRSDHVSQWCQSGRPASVYMPELCQGEHWSGRPWKFLVVKHCRSRRYANVNYWLIVGELTTVSRMEKSGSWPAVGEVLGIVTEICCWGKWFIVDLMFGATLVIVSLVWVCYIWCLFIDDVYLLMHSIALYCCFY